MRGYPNKGGLGNRALLTEEVLRLHNTGLSAKEIAENVGVHLHTVNYIVQRYGQQEWGGKVPPLAGQRSLLTQ